MGETSGRSADPLLICAFDRTSLATLRADLNACGAAHGLGDVALAHFVLAVNEIATNAVRHAGGKGRLCLWHDGGALWCEVEDDGPGIAPRHLLRAGDRRADRIGGHGLWLAQHICDYHDIDTASSGTRITLRYTLPPAAPPDAGRSDATLEEP